MKILAVSDNHGNDLVIKEILNSNQFCDYYFHLGDSEMEIQDLKPFISVKGNMDYDYSLPMDRIVDVNDHSIYLCHGQSYYGDPELIAEYAKKVGCDIAIFGHTHRFFDQTINGVRVINPGSCTRPKDGNLPTYAIIDINNSPIINVLKVEIHNN